MMERLNHQTVKTVLDFIKLLSVKRAVIFKKINVTSVTFVVAQYVAEIKKARFFYRP